MLKRLVAGIAGALILTAFGVQALAAAIAPPHLQTIAVVVAHAHPEAGHL
jgi:hypothetical protein